MKLRILKQSEQKLLEFLNFVQKWREFWRMCSVRKRLLWKMTIVLSTNLEKCGKRQS